jgi:uncharacterized membrane protein YtjA (UPF0391 family)
VGNQLSVSLIADFFADVRSPFGRLHLPVVSPVAGGLGTVSAMFERPMGCSVPRGGSSAAKTPLEDFVMLYWAAVFFVIALIAAVFGFSGIAVEAAGIARILFVVFLVLFVLSLLLGRPRRGPIV